jgi:hypothetical protein
MTTDWKSPPKHFYEPLASAAIKHSYLIPCYQQLSVSLFMSLSAQRVSLQAVLPTPYQRKAAKVNA